MEAIDNVDKAGKWYWDDVWKGRPIPRPVDPTIPGLNNFSARSFHKEFVRGLEGFEARGKRFLEIGCARSTWLPYFAQQFGFVVAGIDYSDLGCEQSRTILDRADIQSAIIHGDFFQPPTQMIEAFDVVFSWGVVEHFENTTDCLSAFARFLRPGGIMITVIPNLTGCIGWLQKHLARSIYDIHVLVDREALSKAHESAGLEVQSCEYFLNVDWNVINLSSWTRVRLRHIASRINSALTKLVWTLDGAGVIVKPNRFTSPFVVCWAEKQACVDR